MQLYLQAQIAGEIQIQPLLRIMCTIVHSTA